MMEWLQEVLRKRSGATVLVSHDRKFLNESCNRLIEIRDGKLVCMAWHHDLPAGAGPVAGATDEGL